MKYFESRTVGEVLSRITNDVDTLGQSLNQSVTILITSVTTIIGVLIMMLTISPLMTSNIRRSISLHSRNTLERSTDRSKKCSADRMLSKCLTVKR